MDVVTENHPRMLDAVVMGGAAKAPHPLLTEVSPSPQPGTADTQISALGLSSNSRGIHGNADTMIQALGLRL